MISSSSFGQVADEEQQGRRRHGGRGPGRGGAELLARPRPGQERLDAGDGHPVAVLHVAAAWLALAAAAVRTVPGIFSGLLPAGRVPDQAGERDKWVLLCMYTSCPVNRVCARARLRAGNRVPVPRRTLARL